MLSRNVVLPSGTILSDRYRVEHKLGEGGMGIVYEVTHLNTGQRMALKTLREIDASDPELIARFLNESRLTAAIKSEHIVKVTDADTDPERGVPFFVMELLEGDNLGTLLKDGRRFTPQEIIVLLRQASLALDRTHAIDIVHRDLKPENLFLTTRDDGRDCLKILDFGIAKVVDPGTYADATRNLGTLLYMSPEQFEGDPHIDHRSDLYSFALVAFTLLVGHPYWEPEAKALGALVRSIAQGAPELATRRARRCWNVELPAGFDAWFAKAAGKDADARFESASELVDDLASALGVEPDRSSPPIARSIARPAVPVASKRTKRSETPRLALGTTAAAVILGVGAAAIFLLFRPDQDPSPDIRSSPEIQNAGAPAARSFAPVQSLVVAPAASKTEEPASDPPSALAAPADVASSQGALDSALPRAVPTHPATSSRGASAPAGSRSPNKNASTANPARPNVKGVVVDAGTPATFIW
jgi:serine/threonine protein kinase